MVHYLLENQKQIQDSEKLNFQMQYYLKDLDHLYENVKNRVLLLLLVILFVFSKVSLPFEFT